MTDQQPTPTKRAPRRRRRAPAKAPAATAPASATPAPETSTAPAAAGAPTPHDTPAFVSIPIHVRWHDLDAFNHVNNASFLVLLEEARLQWLRQVPGEWFGEHAMPVMAAIDLKYLKPVTWPADIDVELGCVKLGTSSVTLRNRVVERSDRSCVYADGTIVLVWIDPATGKPVALPEAIRTACGS